MKTTILHIVLIAGITSTSHALILDAWRNEKEKTPQQRNAELRLIRKIMRLPSTGHWEIFETIIKYITYGQWVRQSEYSCDGRSWHYQNKTDHWQKHPLLEKMRCMAGKNEKKIAAINTLRLDQTMLLILIAHEIDFASTEQCNDGIPHNPLNFPTLTECKKNKKRCEIDHDMLPTINSLPDHIMRIIRPFIRFKIKTKEIK